MTERGDPRPEPDGTPAVPGEEGLFDHPAVILLVEDQPELVQALA